MKQKEDPNETMIKKAKRAEAIEKDSMVYQASLFELPIQFVLGKQLKDPDDKTALVLPIYAFSQKVVRYAIGYYRIKEVEFPDAVLEEGGYDISKLGEPIFFKKVKKGKSEIKLNLDFVSKELDIHRPVEFKEEYIEESLQGNEKDKPEEKDQPNEKDQPDEEKSLFHIKKQKRVITEEIFEKKKKVLPVLPEETEEMMEKQQEEYKISRKEQKEKNNQENKKKGKEWINEYMIDKSYELEEKPAKLLESIILAFEDQGWTTTEEKLRSELANRATLAQYNEEMGLWKKLKERIQQIQEDHVILKERLKAVQNHLQHPSLTPTDRETFEEEKDRIDAIIKRGNQNMKHFEETILCWVPTLSETDTFDSYRDSIRQSNPNRSKHPMNPILVRSLEKMLQIKIVFFNETFPSDFVINMLPPISEEQQMVQFYVLISSKEQLIRYKSRGILTFQELPYAVKARIAMRSIEDPENGTLRTIKEFQLWAEKAEIESMYIPMVQPLQVDPGVRFVVGPAVPDNCPLVPQSTPVGFSYLDIERIPTNRIPDFLGLDQMPKDWRRRLSDDDMLAKFELDGHVWKSISHFLLALPFKDRVSVYTKFTANQGRMIEEAIQLAKESMSTKDPEMSETQKQELRMRALMAKFQQNEDIKMILKETKDAVLMIFKRGHELETDSLLMDVRSRM